MKTINFCVCCDDNYVKPVCVTMASAIINLRKGYESYFYVLYNGKKKKIKEFCLLEKKFNCHVILLNVRKYKYIFKNQKQEDFKLEYISITTLYRLLMFKILDKSIDKIFYLDSDMVINCNLADLYESFPDNMMFGGVVEIQATKHKAFILSHLYKYSYFENLLKDYDSFPYFNAGFYLVNLELCYKNHIFEEMLKFLDIYPNPAYADQDILNAIFGQKFRNLTYYFEPKYNVFCNINYYEFLGADCYYQADKIKEAFYNPQICHYCGDRKPWNNIAMNHNDIWWKYAYLCDFLSFKRAKKYVYAYKLFSLFTIYTKDF